MKKRLLSIITALTMVLGLFASFPAAAANTRDPFQELAFGTYDDYSAEPAPRVWLNHGIYEQKDGYWISFKNVNFSSAPKSVTLSVYSYQPTSNQSGYIELRLDAPNGLLIAEIHPKPSPGWAALAETKADITEEITGVHDIYAIYRGTHYDNRVGAIKFAPKSDKALSIKGKTPDMAYSDSYDENAYITANKLAHLGLMTPVNSTTFGFDNPFTVEEALVAASRMLGMDFETEVKTDGKSESQYYKEFGYDKGVDFGKYVAGDPITTEDFTGLVLGVLGWNDVIKAKNSTVMRQAQELKLFNGVSAYKANGFITKWQASKILENALEAKFLSISGFYGDSLTYDVINEEGVMSVYDDVYRAEGIINHNHMTSVASDAEDLELSQIKIDGKIYNTGNTDIMYSVGKMVDFYFRYDEATRSATVLYYEELADDEVSITSEQLIKIGMNKAEYEENGKIKTVTFNPACPVIYNGTFAQNYSSVSSLVGDADKFRGSISFVNNDSDKEADVIIVEKFKSVILKTFNERDGIVTDVDGVQYDLKAGNSDYRYVAYDEMGNAADPTLSAKGTVFDIAASHNNGEITFNKIIVCANNFYGEVTKMESDYIYVDGSKHRLSAEIIDAGLLTDHNRIEIGAVGTFYVDSLGYIRSFVSGAKTMAAVIVDYDVANDAFVSDFKFKLYTNDGEMIIADAADKITIDGYVLDTPEAIKNYLDTLTLRGTAAIYRLNNKSQVNMIDTYETGKGGDKDVLTRICNKITYQLYNGVGFGNTNSGAVAYNGSLVFNTPFENGPSAGDETAYSVSTGFGSGYSQYDMYSTTGNAVISDMAVRYTESGNIGKGKDFLVEKIKQVCNENGEITAAVDGWFINTRPERGSVEFDTITGYDSYFTDEIKPGDVLRLGYDAKGKVVNAGTGETAPNGIQSKIFATDSLGTVDTTLNRLNTTNSSEALFWFGEIVDIVDNFMIIDTTGNGNFIVTNISDASVLCYENDVKKAKQGSLNDIVLRSGDVPGTGTKALIKVTTFKAGTILYYK